MDGWSRLGRIAGLPTTTAGVEQAFSYLIAGVRLGTVAQMIPAVNAGAAVSPRPFGYLACWAAAAVASVAVSVVTLVRRRPLGAAASAADLALACALLLLGPLVLEAGERLGTWIAFQPAYALAIIITSSGVRSLSLWAGGLLGTIACYLTYLGAELEEDMAPSVVGNILTFVVYALITHILFGYVRRIGHDADASRARAAELARREEERRAQVAMHNGVAVMRLLTEPVAGVPRSGLIDLAEMELRRMRSYLRGRAPGGEESVVAGGDAEGPAVALAVLIQRVCDRFADLAVDTLLDLGAGLRVPAAQAEALRRALESLLLNVRAHARATAVVVHLEQSEDTGWTLTVRDDGIGFDPVSVRAGVGLREVVGGELRRRGLDVEIESAAGDGTTVTISSGPPAATAGVERNAFVEGAA